MAHTLCTNLQVKSWRRWLGGVYCVALPLYLALRSNYPSPSGAEMGAGRPSPKFFIQRRGKNCGQSMAARLKTVGRLARLRAPTEKCSRELLMT
jgi:hypothetical protein